MRGKENLEQVVDPTARSAQPLAAHHQRNANQDADDPKANPNFHAGLQRNGKSMGLIAD